VASYLYEVHRIEWLVFEKGHAHMPQPGFFAKSTEQASWRLWIVQENTTEV
jgi:hypothetical protein